jgi:hypothetical protein
MADQSKQPAPSIGGNGFIWILLVAAGTYLVVQQGPLEGSRPLATERSVSERPGAQDIEARLWQDPFAAVAETLKRSSDHKPENCAPDKIKDQIKDHCRSPLKDSHRANPLVLVVSVSGAPYSDDREFRLRTRYAVLAGLNAEGFVPEDPQHIGFFWPEALAADQSRDKLTDPPPKVVPFEWFKDKSDRKDAPHPLVLWFDEDVLRDTPLKQFDAFMCSYLVSGSTPWVKSKILGPQLSTTLKAMVNEDGEDWSNGSCRVPARPEFYVYSATTADATLIPEYVAASGRSCIASGTCLGDFFEKEKQVKLYRMIATDQALARSLKDELKIRHVDSVDPKHPNPIALVSEWDSVYGRALPESMARCLGEQLQCKPDVDPFRDKLWLHPFKYLRGLDGQMPNAGGSISGNDSGDKDNRQDKDTKGGTTSQRDAKTRDRAEGQGQFDYLRRLGESMQQLDAELRLKEDPKGIEAIGVLGSDLYDKLLVLQALRPLFPEALFFTTDLDALLLHPVTQNPTRNLLVASSFGLQLRPEIQGEIPPFRSSYQTAGFLATRFAIRNDAGQHPPWLSQPLLFEIGASRAFQFPRRASGEPPAPDAKQAEECRADLLKCNEIQPAAAAMAPPVSRPLAVLLSLLVVFLAASFPALRHRTRDYVDAIMRGAKSPVVMGLTLAMMVIGLCIVIAAIAAAIEQLWPPLATWLTAGGEPITLLEGISVWPTVFFRLVALALCIWLIIHGWRKLDANMIDIYKDLHLAKARDVAKAEQAELVRNSAPWMGFASLFWYRFSPDDDAIGGKAKPSQQSTSRFWRRYIYQGRSTARGFRIAGGVAGMFVFAWILSAVFGDSFPPTRGQVSPQAYLWIVVFLFIAMLFLIFFVADATLLCWSIVKAFRQEKNIWPTETLQEFGNRLALRQPALKPVLEDWIALVFVSERTKCITALIYYPFLIIALLVVSRSRLFANYAGSVPILIVIGLSVLIVISCAVALNWSAEASRAKARQRLNDEIVKAKNSKDEGRLASQLEMMLRRVEELREGAFSPFTQQPVVRAILLPLGSFGGTQLLEYLRVFMS